MADVLEKTYASVFFLHKDSFILDKITLPVVISLMISQELFPVKALVLEQVTNHYL